MAQSSIGNTILFTGREYDAESGTYYYRARSMHPNVGRFMQHDPLIYVDGMNDYSYVGNMPIIMFDAVGMSKKVTWAKTKKYGIIIGGFLWSLLNNLASGPLSSLGSGVDIWNEVDKDSPGTKRQAVEGLLSEIERAQASKKDNDPRSGWAGYDPCYFVGSCENKPSSKKPSSKCDKDPSGPKIGNCFISGDNYICITN